MKFDYDGYVLSDGTEFYANKGLLSLGDDGELYEGYDGKLTHECKLDLEAEPLSRAQKEEIAATMIARWLDWAGLTGSDWIRRK